MQYHLYTLRSRGALNAVSSRQAFHGALIMHEGGVGCLHPWPEFGDDPVETQLSLMREGKSSRVIERALRMAQVDGKARREGVSLFEGLSVPRSHYSWDQHQSFTGQVNRVVEEGWLAVKTKGAKDLITCQNWLEKFARTAPGVKARIDFNSCLSETEFVKFWRGLSSEARQAVDFIEDPYPYHPGQWLRTRTEENVRLALDKQLRGAVQGFDVAVLKPGRRDWRAMVAELPEEVPLILTSAMDHAIGQSFAAWEAASAAKELGNRVDLCGLCTEHLFEADPFFEVLHSSRGFLSVDRTGTGLGFDELIARLGWRTL